MERTSREEWEDERVELQKKLTELLAGNVIEEVMVEDFAHPHYHVQLLLRFKDGLVIQVPHQGSTGFTAIKVKDLEQVSFMADLAPSKYHSEASRDFYLRAAQQAKSHVEKSGGIEGGKDVSLST